MFYSGSSKSIVEHSVHSTGVPLSERFKKVPSHNPLRQKFGGQRVAADDDLLDPSDNGIPSGPLGPMRRNPVAQFGGGAGVNKLAVLRATKDAEILRLRAQVRTLQLKLAKLGNGRLGNFNANRKLPMRNRIGNYFVKNRGGGGVVLERNGKRLNFSSSKSIKSLGLGAENVVKIPRSTLNRNSNTVPTNLNFFGTPKSKDDLDEELEKYMSKSKTKQKTDLDKELDEYMKVARQQSFAGKVGLLAEMSTADAAEGSEDAEMEIVE